MFPVEKPSMLNTIARGALGEIIPSGSISMINLLDEDSLNKIAESAGAKAWKGFVTFGSASAGVLAIFIIIRVVKLIIDTLIHGYALHSVYGWSMHLLGAVWSSVTHLLIHLGREPKSGPSAPEDAPPQTSSSTEAHPPNPKTLSERVRSETNTNPTYTYSELRRYVKDSQREAEIV
ncbi:uncharacterized protein LOC113002854 [Solenopsis invicta]|uniref:uncharacterized protein LOC113002854 n=1 Tax=Solenopsis invicta TaxID=13686 RepID=UPI00193E0B51|nr:uncharacterized protein LOC113002854 [Solenopsis invicta]